MTRLEAVNEILQRCGQHPAPGLETGKASRAAQAERVLDRVNRRVQQREWHFNTRRRVTLTTTLVESVYKFVVATDTLNIRPEEGEIVRFSEHNGVLFDLDNNTDVWAQTDTLLVRYAVLVPVEQAPHAIAEYITAVAAVAFNEEYIKDPYRVADLARTERSAKAAALQTDIRSARTNMLTTTQAREVKGFRDVPGLPSNE